MIFRLLIAAAAFFVALPVNFASAARQLLGLLADNEIPVHASATFAPWRSAQYASGRNGTCPPGERLTRPSSRTE